MLGNSRRFRNCWRNFELLTLPPSPSPSPACGNARRPSRLVNTAHICLHLIYMFFSYDCWLTHPFAFFLCFLCQFRSKFSSLLYVRHYPTTQYVPQYWVWRSAARAAMALQHSAPSRQHTCLGVKMGCSACKCHRVLHVTWISLTHISRDPVEPNLDWVPDWPT